MLIFARTSVYVLLYGSIKSLLLALRLSVPSLYRYRYRFRVIVSWEIVSFSRNVLRIKTRCWLYVCRDRRTSTVPPVPFSIPCCLSALSVYGTASAIVSSLRIRFGRYIRTYAFRCRAASQDKARKLKRAWLWIATCLCDVVVVVLPPRVILRSHSVGTFVRFACSFPSSRRDFRG